MPIIAVNVIKILHHYREAMTFKLQFNIMF